MTDPASYELGPRDLERGWRHARALLLAGRKPAPDPVFLLVGGQPAAGKSWALADSTKVYADRMFAVLDSDVLRPLHPAFDEIIAKDLLRMPVLTDQAATMWLRRAIQEARSARLSVALENSFTSPDILTHEAGLFRDNGYRVHVVVLATPAEVSRLAMVDRCAPSIGSLSGRGPEFCTTGRRSGRRVPHWTPSATEN